MAAITPEGPSQFRVSFAELAKKGRFGRAEAVQVDPWLIGRAIAEVMAACTVRSATGKRLVWNEYRVVLAREDYEELGPLAKTLERDLRQALRKEVGEGELVGELSATVVADEGDELARGSAVVRASFAPSEQKGGPGETVHFDVRSVKHMEPENTVGVSEIGARAYMLRWPGGEAPLPIGVEVTAGRPHPEHGRAFIALEGASPKINKEHVRITTGARSVRVARPSSANPVQVNGRALAPGESIEAVPPLQIVLSKGDLVLSISGA